MGIRYSIYHYFFCKKSTFYYRPRSRTIFVATRLENNLPPPHWQQHLPFPRPIMEHLPPARYPLPPLLNHSTPPLLAGTTTLIKFDFSPLDLPQRRRIVTPAIWIFLDSLCGLICTYDFFNLGQL